MGGASCRYNIYMYIYMYMYEYHIYILNREVYVVGGWDGRGVLQVQYIYAYTYVYV